VAGGWQAGGAQVVDCGGEGAVRSRRPNAHVQRLEDAPQRLELLLLIVLTPLHFPISHVHLERLNLSHAL
jgi:hypothetical protein